MEHPEAQEKLKVDSDTRMAPAMARWFGLNQNGAAEYGKQMPHHERRCRSARAIAQRAKLTFFTFRTGACEPREPPSP